MPPAIKFKYSSQPVNNRLCCFGAISCGCSWRRRDGARCPNQTTAARGESKAHMCCVLWPSHFSCLKAPHVAIAQQKEQDLAAWHGMQGRGKLKRGNAKTLTAARDRGAASVARRKRDCLRCCCDTSHTRHIYCLAWRALAHAQHQRPCRFCV